MDKYYTYALADPENIETILEGGEWTRDYPAIRRAQRAAAKAGINGLIIKKEVKVSDSERHNDLRYDIDNLIADITPILASLGYMDADGENDEERFNEIERLVLLLMPFFGEAIAGSIVAQAIEMYPVDDEDHAVVMRNDSKRDVQFDKASIVRHISGVKGWSNSAGVGLTLDDVK